MDEVKLANDCLQLARLDLGLENDFMIEGSNQPFQWLEKILEERIKIMLDEDFRGLINAFYRIDIAENTIQKILELAPPDEVALELARAVIVREKKKVITRERYRQS